MSKKRKDECVLCTKRACYHRICTQDLSYDEVNCYDHVQEAEKHADKVLGGRGSGVMRTHISSTAKQSRGVAVKAL